MDVKERVSLFKGLVREHARREPKPETAEAAKLIVCFAGGFALSLVRILGNGGPFGIAAVAAAGAGFNGLACLLGALVGYLLSLGVRRGIRFVAAAVLVFTAEFAFQDTRLYKKPLFAPVTGAAVCCLTGFLAAFTDVVAGTPTAAILLLETVLTLGGSALLRDAMSEHRPETEAEERRHFVSVLITVALLVTALSEIKLMREVSPGRVAALLAVMTAALRCGMGLGCTVGTVFGLCLDLSRGGIPFFTMSYAFSGFLAGLFSKRGRVGFALVFLMASAVTVICCWSASPQLGAIVELICACIVFLFLPARLLDRLGALIEPVGVGEGEAGLRRYVAGRIEGIAQAYAELYATVRRHAGRRENDSDPAQVFDRAAEAVCSGCREKNHCWNSQYIDTLSALNDASVAMQKRGRLNLEDIPAHFVERCRTPEALVAAVNGELRASNVRRQLASVLSDSRDTAWGQFADTAEILSTVAGELTSPNGADHPAERRILRCLRSQGIEAEVSVYRDGGGRLRAVLEGAGLDRLCEREDYLDRLSEAVGLRLCRPLTERETPGRLILAEAEPLAVSVGIASMKKCGETVSGDKGLCFKTDYGVLCILLSDGMGCGTEAERESSAVIGILERFLRSGLDPAAAMKTLNSVMLLQSPEHWGFATVDLMCIDMFTGETCFYKYGAAPSYVMENGTIRRIRGETLAPGLAGAGQAPDTVHMLLRPGCTAIVASDGVMGEGSDAWLREVLDSATDDMRLLARDTLREAERCYGSVDDMTVLAVHVESRE